MIKDFYKQFQKLANKMKDRSLISVAFKASEEMGELSTAVAIHEGFSYKKEDEDGVLGEAVDLMLNAMDVAVQFGASPEEVEEMFNKKTSKWLKVCGKPVLEEASSWCIFLSPGGGSLIVRDLRTHELEGSALMMDIYLEEGSIFTLAEVKVYLETLTIKTIGDLAVSLSEEFNQGVKHVLYDIKKA